MLKEFQEKQLRISQRIYLVMNVSQAYNILLVQWLEHFSLKCRLKRNDIL